MSVGNPVDSTPGEKRNDPRPLLALLVALCLLLVVTYALRLDERDQAEAAIVAQERANDAARARGAELQEALAQVKKPAYVDGIIRTILLMGKEGDTRLVAVPVPNAPQPAQPAAPATHAGSALPLWRQWLEALSGGGPPPAPAQLQSSPPAQP